MKNILMLGTFDSKGLEFQYLYKELIRRGVHVTAMNVGIFDPAVDFPVDIPAEKVAEKGGVPLSELRKNHDRGNAMKVMCQGVGIIARQLCDDGKIHGVIGMGGGGGTSIATSAMQALPLGFPKVCISTLASGDTSEYMGTKDIVLFPSIVDVCGLNPFLRMIISRAAGAVCGMAEMDPLLSESYKPVVAISMFGNTTPCVEKCVSLLEERGYSSVIFHTTGTGGKCMENFIREGNCVACLDITTTEWADEVCGGLHSAGKDRLDAPGAVGIPHVIAPGALDMVNFGSISTVPQKYIQDQRLLSEWNPMVTLMRSNAEENVQLGKILAEKANASKYPVAFILPLRGLSILDGEGECFCDWETDRKLYASIEENVNPGIEVRYVDANINDPEFAIQAVELLMKLLGTGGE